ncbi:MAG TPA: aspartate aminotransferase family protein [Rhizomicrobium sp.]|jgi:glutamate/tyrosine decarboxylase-like PLP-dependent enzyme
MPKATARKRPELQPATGCDVASLDPEDWSELRGLGHRMLDDMFEYLEHVRQRPVWQPMPESVRAEFRTAIPQSPSALAEVYDEFSQSILPYALGNVHPGFMGWVHGGGTAVGMLAEMLASGLNSNVGGRDHAAVVVEQQIVRWMRELFDFPEGASGVFVTGTSAANLLAVLVARTQALGCEIRKRGLGEEGAQLRAYASRAAHGCVARATDIAGLGSDALRTIETDARHRLNVQALAEAVRSDRASGLSPFLVVGTAGTVDIGAIDDLAAIAEFCRREGLWFHVDGAFGALGIMSPHLAPRLAGIEQADSIAFDFHKWGQVPYDAGFLLVRDGARHEAAFASPAAYLQRHARGMAAGSPWPCDLSFDLSRGFRALKTWFALKTFGTERLGEAMHHCCEVARHLAERIAAEPSLELLAPVQLNIVCFRHRAAEPNSFNTELAVRIQESGIAAPSTTMIDGQVAIRAAITNHRTQVSDADALVDAALRLAKTLAREQPHLRLAEEPAPDAIPMERRSFAPTCSGRIGAI